MADWKKILGTSVLSASLVFSSFAPVLGNVPAASAKNKIVHNVEGKLPFLNKHVSGPFDAGMVNREKVLAALIKQGVISKNASHAQQEKQLNAYLSKRANKAIELTADQLDQKAVRTDMQKTAGLELVDAGVPKAPKEEAEKASKHKVGSIIEEGWDGEVQTDQVLVLLIDFPDYKNSSITEADDPVLMYEDYTKEHYEQMVFGDSTFKGGNDEDFISMKEFYEQQSGGSYTIDGAVSDWYTASQPAAYYGGNDANDNDARPRELAQEALAHASNDPNIDLSKFDVEDLYDLDGDGNYREADGIIDHLMIVHAGTGEEAGGGTVGADAIWSHSWNQAEPVVIPGTEGEAGVPYWDGSLTSYDYTIQPEDGATGVFAHEYGHDLGLPDEYDTAYTANSVGAPTEYWTLMSAGSWAGIINGTEPTGFSPHNKEYLQNKWPNSNWFKNVEYSLDDIKNGEKIVNLDQASVKGTNADAVKITLPDKVTQVNTPANGEFEYFSGKGNDLDNSLTTTVDLTSATNAEFKFNAWYDIEQDWDYASLQVNDGSGWVAIQGNLTTDTNPYEQNPGHGITGSTNGEWVPASFDLSAYAGKEVQVKINYWTDVAATLPGLYVDDIEVVVDGTAVVTDGAESDESVFTADGFTKSTGTTTSEHYYLVEWRNWAATDTALGRITRGNSVLTYDPGMVIWYVDNKYDDNWVGDHPGDGFLGVVDAHQPIARWTDDNSPATTRYQIQDAAFSLDATDDTFLDYSEFYGPGVGMALDAQPAVPQFSDYNDYSTPDLVYAGRLVPQYGLEISVLDQAEDMTVGQVQFAYDDHQANVQVSGLLDTYSSNEDHNSLELTVVSDDETFGEEVTVTTDVVNAANEVVVSDVQTYTSNRTEKELAVGLTLPVGLPTGEYALEVSVNAGETNVASYSQAFAVDNSAPTLELNGDNPLVIEALSEFVDPGFTASDDVDGDVTEQVVVTGQVDVTIPGEYTLTYSVTDKVGNQTTVTRSVKVVDTQAPTLELKGANPLEVAQGSTYVDPGYTAADKVDGDLTSKVKVSGKVDTKTVGTYTLTYTVVDAAGNKTTAERTVKVNAAATGGTGSDTGSDNGSTGGGSGSALPDTATNAYNIMLAGLLTLVLGVAFFVLQRRRKGLTE
jgi:M6 family metalloprotease-like protein/LPXTG-motif cell wall-anchored protein